MFEKASIPMISMSAFNAQFQWTLYAVKAVWIYYQNRNESFCWPQGYGWPPGHLIFPSELVQTPKVSWITPPVQEPVDRKKAENWKEFQFQDDGKEMTWKLKKLQLHMVCENFLVQRVRSSWAKYITILGEAKPSCLHISKLNSVFHHLPSFGPKQLCAWAHLGYNHKAGTS